MSKKRILWTPYLFLVSLMMVTPALGQPPPPTPEGQDEQPDGVSVQMRGPVHEAFAQPYQAKPESGFELPKPPPKPIDEVPPEIGPEDDGRNLTWIPGYWAWDGERYVWVSGMWRYPPPGTRWVPGHWVRTEAGANVWVSGFWVQEDVKHLGYLPPPPEPRNLHPTTEPPHENAFWVPGCWLYQEQQYRWRSGFWARARQDWVWFPARYVWTPRGYIFTSGYWDYRPERRGTLFAPVYFSQQFRGRYRPRVLLNVGNLLVHLFARPRYQHYYFGDYYGAGGRGGLYPWLSFGGRDRYYDPLLTYYGAVRANDLARIRQQYRYFETNSGRRPPTAWSAYGRYIDGFDANNVPAGAAIALQAEQALRTPKIWQMQRFDEKRITPYANSLQYYQNLGNLRNKFEARPMEKAKGQPFRNFNVPPGQIQRPFTPGKGNKGKFIQPGKGGKGQFVPPGKGRIIPPGKGNKGKFTPPGQLNRNLPDVPRFVPRPNPGRPPGFPGKGKGKGGGKGKGKGKR